MTRSVAYVIAAVLLGFVSTFGQKTRPQLEKEVLDNLLKTYNSRSRPAGPNDTVPLAIEVDIAVQQVDYLRSDTQEWRPLITLNQVWTDERLAYNLVAGRPEYLVVEDVGSIWRPDTYFTNSKLSAVGRPVGDSLLLRIYPNGSVYYSSRLALELDCPQELVRYPFDRPACAISLASCNLTVPDGRSSTVILNGELTAHKYPTDDLVYVWRDDTPVEVSQTLRLSRFKFERVVRTSVSEIGSPLGNYSVLRAELLFERESHYYCRNWLLPTAVITLVSFVSFWLRRDRPRRIVTLVAALLLLYLQIALINKSAPPVAYSTAIDCWNSTCLLFVIGALVEYAIVRAIDRCRPGSAGGRSAACNESLKESNGTKSSRLEKNVEEGDAVALKPLVTEDGQDNHVDSGDGAAKEYTVNEVSNRRNFTAKWRQLSLGGRVDLAAAFVFPLLFVIYIVTFLAYANLSADDQQ